MEFNFFETPRTFSPTDDITLSDVGEISLGIDEQITLKTEDGRSNDIVRKEWGFYLCNSANRSLRRRGFRTAIVLSQYGGGRSVFVNIVEDDKMAEFQRYLAKNDSQVVCWLDEWFGAE